MSRFKVTNESQSGHCCFGFTVVDTTKPVMYHGKHYKGRFETLCECFEEDSANLICKALNAVTAD
jgi:hypothetical protein